MEENYEEIINELIARRKQLIELGFESLPPKIQGDYNEAILRDLIRATIDDKYEVKQGIIHDDKGRKPLFETKNLVVVNEDDVAFVLEARAPTLQ